EPVVFCFNFTLLEHHSASEVGTHRCGSCCVFVAFEVKELPLFLHPVHIPFILQRIGQVRVPVKGVGFNLHFFSSGREEIDHFKPTVSQWLHATQVSFF